MTLASNMTEEFVDVEEVGEEELVVVGMGVLSTGLDTTGSLVGGGGLAANMERASSTSTVVSGSSTSSGDGRWADDDSF